MKWRFLSLILFSLLCVCHHAQAQEAAPLTLEERMELFDKIQEYIEEMSSLSEFIGNANEGQVNSIHNYSTAIDLRWNNFCQMSMPLIAQDDSLMQTVVEYEQVRQFVNDSIVSRQKQITRQADFIRVEKRISEQVEPYAQLYTKAQLLSLHKASAQELDKLKAKEQLLFASLEKDYNLACEAVDGNPQLHERMQQVETNFITIKSQSIKIQAAQYQPLLARIKDYLLSFAAVSIIVMFFVFVSSRIAAIKKMRKTAKEMAKLMEKNNQDYPTI